MPAKAELDFSRLYVLGAGAHGREVAWLADSAWRRKPEIVFLVNQQEHLTAPIDGHPVRLLLDEELSEESRFVAGVGDPAVRRQLVRAMEARGGIAATIVHSSVQRSSRVVISSGAVIFPGAILTTNVTIGRHAHVNAACTISHDSSVGDFSTLSPGVHVAGRVHVGEGVFVGIGANVINGTSEAPLEIGDGAVIAAGACVIRPVKAGTMVAGVPAVRKR